MLWQGICPFWWDILEKNHDDCFTWVKQKKMDCGLIAANNGPGDNLERLYIQWYWYEVIKLHLSDREKEK